VLTVFSADLVEFLIQHWNRITNGDGRMFRPRHPYIIDIEASGLGARSYPIEVGLALEPGRRYCTLIRPVDHWDHWDEQAESIHRISRQNLLTAGQPVTEVAARLNDLLRNRVVFSDAWGVDTPWIIELYAAAGIDKTFTISSLEMILSEQQMEVWAKTRDSVVLDLGLRRHRASNDAWIIQETFVRTLAMSS
jgi:hypothetical protein